MRRRLECWILFPKRLPLASKKLPQSRQFISYRSCPRAVAKPIIHDEAISKTLGSDNYFVLRVMDCCGKNLNEN